MNIKHLRKDTPGTEQVIHFNNAGASLMPVPVSNTVKNYIDEESQLGGYEAADKYRDEIERTYPTIAAFINAQPQEIALLENATAAWNMAFFAINFDKGDRILTSKSEYASNFISYLKIKEKFGVTVDVIPNDEYGQTSVKALQDKLDDDFKLVSITHIPTNSGLVNPAEEIGQIIKNHHCLYLVDACQSAGQYPVDVQKMGCDMLSATGRKYLRGPRGTGFLYVKKDVVNKLIPPFLDLHAAEWTSAQEYNIREDARRFENWEMNYAGILGLQEAVSYAESIGIAAIWKRLTYLAKILRSKLSNLPGATVQDIGQTKGGIVSFTVEHLTSDLLKEKLRAQNINISSSTVASTRLDMEDRELAEVARASVHYYNTESEINTFAESLGGIVNDH